ncbi:MAG TPA: hypothetical protein VG944_23265, partial [Fimbriimonas sp.]|nr:hypothetical protein [Fimbriimonas sp.]
IHRWLGETRYPTGPSYRKNTKIEFLYSFLDPTKLGTPSKALFTSKDFATFGSPNGRIVAVAPMKGLAKFAMLLERRDWTITQRGSLRFSSLLYSAGKLERFPKSSRSNPFRVWSGRTTPTPKLVAGYFDISYDPVGNRLAINRGTYTLLLDTEGHFRRLDAPKPYGRIECFFAQGRLLANAFADRLTKRRLLEWDRESYWHDLGPYSVRGESASGRILLVAKENEGAKPGPFYLVWPSSRPAVGHLQPRRRKPV